MPWNCVFHGLRTGGSVHTLLARLAGVYVCIPGRSMILSFMNSQLLVLITRLLTILAPPGVRRAI